jgi:hypothetical protein
MAAIAIRPGGVWHVIFQSNNGAKGSWLDYCREEPAVSSENGAAAWAADQACKLARKLGIGVRFKLEHW